MVLVVLLLQLLVVAIRAGTIGVLVEAEDSKC
jgi:hypothetical protein